MPAPTPNTPPPSPMDGLKTYIAAQIGTTIARIGEMDGKVEEALGEFKKLGKPEEVVAQLARLNERLELQEKRGDDLEAGRISPPGHGSRVNNLSRSFDQDLGKAYLSQLRKVRGRQLYIPGTPGIEIPSLLRMARATVDSDAIPVPQANRAGMVDYLLNQTSIANRVPIVEIESDTYRVYREDKMSGEGGIVSRVDGAVAAATTTAIKLVSVANLVNGATLLIERTDGAGTLLGYEEKIVASFVPATRIVTCTVQIVGAVADGDKISYSQFAATAEAVTKPYTEIGMTPFSVVLEFIASLMGVTMQAFRNNAGLEDWIRRRMGSTNIRNIAYQLLYGTGAATQLHGFLTHALRQTYNWSEGAIGDCMADALFGASLLIPDTDGGQLIATLSRNNWHQMRSEKMVDGGYLHTNNGPLAIIHTASLKAVGDIIVETESQLKANGDFMLANHGRASEIVRRGPANLLFGYVSTDFADNKMTARYEEELQHAILSNQAYVHGNFNNRPVAP